MLMRNNYSFNLEKTENEINQSRNRMMAKRRQYRFYPIDIYDLNRNQMFIYADKKIIELNSEYIPGYEKALAKCEIDNNTELWNYVHYGEQADDREFWLDAHQDFIVFFGEEKKSVIYEYINKDYERVKVKKRELVRNNKQRG